MLKRGIPKGISRSSVHIASAIYKYHDENRAYELSPPREMVNKPGWLLAILITIWSFIRDE